MGALKVSPTHFTHFKTNPKDKNEVGVTICLGCTGPVKKIIPSAQTGGPPIEVTIQPATDAQLKVLFERGLPLLEEYETTDDTPAPKVVSAPPPAATKDKG